MTPFILVPLAVLAYVLLLSCLIDTAAEEEEGTAVDENGHLFTYTKIIAP